MNSLKLLKTSSVKFCSAKYLICCNYSNFNNRYYNKVFSEICKQNTNGLTHNNRQLSVQSSVEALGRNQTGLFKALSESTPVEYLQKCLLTIHDTTGLPWWASIICTTVLLRTCVTVPLAIHQSYILAKLENLKLEMPDIVKQLKQETALAIKMYKWDEKMARITYNRSIRKQWNNLIVRDNCHPFKASILLWFQIPMWISLSIGLRNLVYMLPNEDIAAQITFTQLSVGGFGWIPNLTVVDSSLILPIALGVINLLIIELQTLSKINAPSKFQRVITNVFRGFSILMIPISASVPSCLVLYWTTSSAYGLVQNLVLMSPKVKRFCRIPETSIELEQPYAHVKAGITNRIKSLTGTNKII